MAIKVLGIPGKKLLEDEVAPQFLRDVYGVLVPGTTLVVTDSSVSKATTGRKIHVLNADRPVG